MGKYLPFVEYVYNNTIHRSIGKIPLQVIEGRPRLPLILKPHEKIFAANEEVEIYKWLLIYSKSLFILYNKGIRELQISIKNL